MKKILSEKIEMGRDRLGYYASDSTWGAYGRFFIQGPCGERLCIVSSGADAYDKLSEGWEHVSVSTRRRIPNWIEMCFVKDLFWDLEECVIQFHPPRSEYVNNNANCLHLWRLKNGLFPLPPSILVGDKTKEELTYEQAVKLRAQAQRGW